MKLLLAVSSTKIPSSIPSSQRLLYAAEVDVNASKSSECDEQLRTQLS